MTDDTNRNATDEITIPDEQEETQSSEPAGIVDELREQLDQSRTREQRLLADYQNLIRRNKEEQSRWVKLATKDFVTELLLPIEHLARAAEQVNDKGLNLVITQFWQTLERHGLKKIETLGKPFDVSLMEAVEQYNESTEVTSEVRPGFTLYGEVVQHAKVILGKAAETQTDKKKKA